MLRRATGSGPDRAADFAHLHVASSYSLRYGVDTPAALAARAAELGMPALALTDRDGLYGAVKHAVACAQAGIAPILGADLALRDEAGGRGGDPARRDGAGRRVTVLAAGKQGWASLCRLVSAAHQGERGDPAVTPDLVAEHAANLVVLLGPGSDAGQAAAARRPDLAAAALRRWRERAETVIEIVDHRAPGDRFRAGRMLELAREQGIPAVLSNAVRYLEPADGPVAQVLDAARQLVPLGHRHRDRYNTRAYLASGAEMARIAARVCGDDDAAGQLLTATADLARWCALDPVLDLGLGGRFVPETGAADPLAELRARCADGLDRRFPAGTGREAARRRAAAGRRLGDELEIIAKTGLASYFLTVADVAALIAGRGIRCSIRGSGAGSLVTYLIGISGIDPMEHGLIMERFLSESREGLPDIDLDVESARRIEAYRAIFDAYSDQRVACVSMMETYRARSAIRDVAAALGFPPHEIDAVAKAFPRIRARHIGGALAELPELRASGLAMPQLSGVFRLAERLDGLPRHIAMHPCGVVLSDATLLDRTPVEQSLEGLPLSQFDKDDVETAGMIKLDVLGVRMQSAMAHALAEIERTTGQRVDLDAVDSRDEPTFDLVSSARTLGCFQIESPGQRELVTKLRPRDLGDLIVDISLFRPGPVNSDMISPYLQWRNGDRVPVYPHDDLVDALSETGGVVIFHEQVLRIIHAMTGCGLSEADRVRRQLSDDQTREEAGEWFRAEASDRGYDEATVARVWEVLESFGGFGFCKAHAAAFAVPTYQSAWLKRHYPAPFYAGVLTHDPGMYPKRVIVGDARLHGIAVLPVDVNASAGDWRSERPGAGHAEAGLAGGGPAGARPAGAGHAGEGAGPGAGVTGEGTGGWGLRAGLREVKGISEAEVARIVAGQPYLSVRDFWERARVSRPVTERLVLVGGFDTLYGISAAAAAGPAGAAELTGNGAAGGARVSRRDLLARVRVLDRSPAAQSSRSRGAQSSRSRGAQAPSAPGPQAPGSPGPQAPSAPSRPGRTPNSLLPRLFTPSSTQTRTIRGAEMTGRGEKWGRGPAAADGGVADGGSVNGRAVGGGPVDRGAAGGGAAGGGPAQGRGVGELLPLGFDGDGFAGLVPAGELPDLTLPERVEAELEILGIDLSQHVLGFYQDLITELGVVRSRDLHRCRAGSRVLVAGVKTATQTPAVRSGQRIIFVTLDDATGPVDLAFFESVQDRCAARVFGSWLLVVAGRVRRAGGAVSVNGTECWDLAALAEIRAQDGIGAVRAAMAAGDVPGAGPAPGGGQAPGTAPAPGTAVTPAVRLGNGFTLSPYAETGAPGAAIKDAPRKLWHASPGSSGG
ncbi:MAG TPA: DNA polymerase III subunit alpha [Streptosporangiaceae bacterium]|nr:DNA polymerase III subunit alpha [Streptosporangiaceae bacterium]